MVVFAFRLTYCYFSVIIPLKTFNEIGKFWGALEIFDINEILKWEHKLQNLENFVANQIIKNALADEYLKEKIKCQLVTLMKIYSVRTVFESCVCIGCFNLKQIQNECNKVLEKNKERFQNNL